MLKIIKKMFNPLFVVLFSAIVSVIIYLIIYFLFDGTYFGYGLVLSICIPVMVSFPISTIMIKHHKQIEKQKEELLRMDILNKRLFTVISHDIRSPIASLKDFTDLIVNDDLDIEKGKKYLNLLSGKIDDLLLFLNDLMIWSKDQMEFAPPKLELFNADSVINSILGLYSDLIKSKELVIIKSNINNELFTDKGNYAFVVRNIIHNAIKFTNNKGTISIDIKNIDNTICTIIKDTGVGISKENIAKILESKELFTSKGTANEIGTGFGTNMCLHYLKFLNGRLLIESEVNKGTEITIVLPKGIA